ncbi:MAG: dTDP-4-amino-4,6-dideoxygalactose transaminase [Planctomycetaceae bacterium]|nr:dTDP-4-amino-4,6-dideoxygalactose transaminase [Planctomycetaceae bacterium]
MTDQVIPYNKPFIAGKELFYIAQAVINGNIAGDGHFTRKCAELLQTRFGIHKVLMTPSCTASLEMAALLCDLKPGDEVIMPSFTFVSTASAVARIGAIPRFVDINPETLNLDERLIPAAINERTRAIWPVHYAGVSCEMDPILATANRHGLAVVEDAAQGVNSFYKGRALGSIGALGTYSFHETKNFICGEGGALCINDPKMVERAEILRDKGTNRKQFLRGQVDKYTWVDVGSSYVPSEICSAFLYAQLEMSEHITQRRRELHEYYEERLSPLMADGLLRLPICPRNCTPNYHIFYLLLPTEGARNELLDNLRRNGIMAVFHYIPLHDSPVGQTYGYRPGDLPVTEDISRRLIRLPLYYTMTEESQARVVAQVESCLRGLGVRFNRNLAA